MTETISRFYEAYAQHRRAEGRALDGEALRSLPYLQSGPLTKEWQVRARSFDAFVARVLVPLESATFLDILDLGAGNGWLSYRMARRGHRATALDIRDDAVDGLGAAAALAAEAPFTCVHAGFDTLPFDAKKFDITLFNAALHYARDLARVLDEAVRVTRRGGIVAILDSPFYRRQADGEAMIAEKRKLGTARFGAAADVLLTQDFIEYLTPQRLAQAQPCLSWRRQRVLYPLWYEFRPLAARLRGARTPSRFDLWTARVP